MGKRERHVRIHFLTRETTFMTSYLLFSKLNPFLKGVYSKSQEFAPKGGAFFGSGGEGGGELFLFRQDPFSEKGKTCFEIVTSPEGVSDPLSKIF